MYIFLNIKPKTIVLLNKRAKNGSFSISKFYIVAFCSKRNSVVSNVLI